MNFAGETRPRRTRWDDSRVTKKTGARRRYTWGERAIIVGAFLLGLLMLLSALIVPMLRWFPAREPSWWGWAEAFLMNVGAAVLLVSPIELFSSRLRRNVEAVETRQEERVEAVRKEAAERTGQLEQKVASLSELNEQVSAEREERKAHDEATFRAFVEDGPTSDSVERALKRAIDRALIHESGVRVPVSDHHRLRLTFRTSSRGLELDLEEIDGDKLATIAWPSDLSTKDAMARVGEAIDKAGHEERVDPTLVFERLSESLLLAAGEPGVRPLVEFFPPEWAVSTTALVQVRNGRWAYEVTHARKDRVTMDAHVKTKPRLDYESYDAAHEVAAYLYAVTAEQARYAEEVAIREAVRRTAPPAEKGMPRNLGGY